MLEMLLDIARRIRWAVYQVSNARFMGIDADIVLHFGFGALIFALAERRLGAPRAAWLLLGVIVAKEIADLFLKSQLRYVTRPTPAVILDIVTDVATGVAGALTVWLVRRWFVRRRGAEEAA